MLDQNEHSTVIRKTRELCEAILQQPGIISLQKNIRAFLDNEAARADYQGLVAKSQALQQKQQQNQALEDAEVEDFESHRERVLGNPAARAYIEAQEDLRGVHHAVVKCLSMSLESGQVPTAEEFEQASCGHGCNCH
jgi:cell fate (sporulation/competence/biofilm development) regulator YlbF (YheA/YmcA/DUF963 family)